MRFTAHDDDRDSVVGRALLILEVFGRGGGREMRLSAIASSAGLPKATTYRLIQILVGRQFLDRRGPYYRPGLRLFELGSLTTQRKRLAERAMPYMTDLFEATHETVHLAVRDGFDLVYVEKLRGHRVGSVPTATGSRMPLHCTALGKTLLAGEPDTLLEATIEHGLEPLTSNTLTSGEHLREAVATARVEGVAFDREEAVLGLSCVSAPVVDADRRVTAALSVSIGVRRMVRVEALAPMVVAAARGISEQLGAPAHYPSVVAVGR
jgi:DNA-binding IclR family transcriptional regulator